ncbi:MAG: helix-turn-helix domain-containing protein [Lachnospiraceae bacterium]|nr:helix-turn-helix domain-containing protein [Lachnospiraceae bacterium]
MENSRIIDERKKLGLSQAELASKLKISQKSISKYERGTRRPSYETLLAMSSIFGVSVDYLIGNDTSTSTVSMSKRQITPGGYNNSIGHWILKTGLGYDEVAQKLGISEDLLMDYVEENITIPYQILIALSEICEVSTDCLLGLKSKSREKDLNNVLPFRYDYRIAKRIRKLCQESNVDTKSSFLENLLCLSSKEVFYLIEYGFIPHMDTLIKLADYFNVSTDYLLCQIDDQSEKVLHSFYQLDEDNKDIIIGKIKECIKEQRNESVAADPSPLKKTGTDNPKK